MGSGYRTFTAGEVLTASNVQNYLQDQAVMVFAGTAARSSAIGTANFEEGMLSYLTDVDKIQVYTGSSWNDVYPSASTNQGLTLINTTSFSGAVSHSFGSNAAPIFTSTYTNYRIQLDNLNCATSNQGIDLRLRANTTDLTAAEYNKQNLSANGSSISGGRDTNQTSWNIGSVGSGANDPSALWVDLYNPQTTKYTNMLGMNIYFATGTGSLIYINGGYVANSNSYNGFTIFCGTNVSGTMSVYGYSK